MVTLDPTTHTYRDSNNNEYISVTRFINKFVPQFDFELKSKQYAAKYGIDVEEVRRSWNQKNKDSTEFGTKIHEQIENNLKNKNFIIQEEYSDLVTEISVEIKNKFDEGKYLLEHPVFDEGYKIAGTSDLIVDNKSVFSVVDFKTNKKIKFTNDFNDKFLFDPISHLPNSEYFKYALQLSFYAYLYEKKTQKKLSRLCFYWLKRKNDSYTSLKDCKWIRYNVPFLKEEVEMCLQYAK